MSQATITGTLSVPPLTDNQVAFINAAAWNAYWNLSDFSFNIDIATGTNYGVVKSAMTTTYAAPAIPTNQTITLNFDINSDGNLTPVTLVLGSTLDALLVSFTTLQNSYNDLRNQMAAAGLITTA